MALRRARRGQPVIGIEVVDDPTKREDGDADAERQAFRAAGGEIWQTRASGPVGSVASLAGIPTLRGSHNAQNAAAALAACLAVGADRARLAAALLTYPGLAHRMEIAGRRGRVLFVNDSKATNADSTEKALASYEGAIFWIAGGLAKEGGIAPLAPYFDRIAKAYLIGKAAPEFAAMLEGKVPHVMSGTLAAAVTQAASDAALSRAPEPVVLLSPACASFDQFADFEDRGNRFRTMVQELGCSADAPDP
jgi:UDP-N-acetylmuramoylalanine--D-glutamate ligase